MTPVVLLLLVSMVTMAAGLENELDQSEPEVFDVLSKANKGLPYLVYDDVLPNRARNADPCTARGCKWPKSGNYVRVPVSISSRYSDAERNLIIRSLLTFHSTTCIRFVWRRRSHRNYLSFFSGSGCWSYVGRQRRGQPISLRRNGCLFTGTVQHEVLHALGFHHEHVRSDRDEHVRILTNNIIPEFARNFQRVQTNNLGTPYDFNSVMHYSRNAFSRNGEPTIISRSNPSMQFGRARDMSSNDIERINSLYNCNM